MHVLPPTVFAKIVKIILLPVMLLCTVLIPYLSETIIGCTIHIMAILSPLWKPRMNCTTDFASSFLFFESNSSLDGLGSFRIYSVENVLDNFGRRVFFLISTDRCKYAIYAYHASILIILHVVIIICWLIFFIVESFSFFFNPG